MTSTRRKRPRDTGQFGQLIVDIAAGCVEYREESTKTAAVELREKGGVARASKLTAEKRAEIARRDAAA